MNEPAARPAEIESFISGSGGRADPTALDQLRPGAPLRLRRGRGQRVEVLTPDGRPLGFLPREDADPLEASDEEWQAARASVAAVVPAFRRSRVAIRVLLD